MSRQAPPIRHTLESIDGIQYLRGIAALMVVAHHARHYFPQADQWTQFGSRGVDIFFVISGFVMAHSTRGFDPAASRAVQAGDFLLKRIIRVVPLYWLALLWTAKRHVLDGATTWDEVRDLFFIPHFHRLYEGRIYPILIPGWTINYEMFFYLVFAASLLAGARRYVVISATFLGLVAAGFMTWKSAPAIFYTSSVIVEFLLGVVVYFSIARVAASPVARRLLPWVTLVAFALLAIDNDDALRGFADGPFAALIVWSAVLWAQGMKVRWLRLLGDASYSIYLFHLATFSIADSLLRRAGQIDPTALNIALVIATHLAVSVAIGFAIHRLIEQPLLDFLRRAVGRFREPRASAAALN